MPDKQAISDHMRRFRVLASRTTNRHIVYLHIHCQMSLPFIAQATGISRKTTERIMLGQLPTKRQLRLLQRVCTATVQELEKLTSYEQSNRTGMYYAEIIHHTVHLGRMLARAEQSPTSPHGKTRR